MQETRKCTQCAAELPADAPEGLCPQCLMKAALGSQASGQVPPPGASAEQPAGHSPPTTPYPSGTHFTAPPIAELAAHFPQLEILELLGQGGMGAVYKARQQRLHRLVALKILPAEVARDPSFAERFTREAQALARLSHPSIVTIYDFGEAAGFYYFLMEFVDGMNLRELLRAGQLEPAQALAIVPQICEALQYAHDEGVVHRDIKPENILIDRRGRVKIADFGLAKLLGRPPASFTLTGSQQVMGTPHYMAPEQLERPQAVDHRADIYSLGVVFYEMLTGELPLGRFAPPSQKVQVDVRLDEVVLRSLEKEPERRYQQASEVKTDIDAISRDPMVSHTGHQAMPVQPVSAADRFGNFSMRPQPGYARHVGLPMLVTFGLWLMATLLIVSFFSAKQEALILSLTSALIFLPLAYVVFAIRRSALAPHHTESVARPKSGVTRPDLAKATPAVTSPPVGLLYRAVVIAISLLGTAVLFLPWVQVRAVFPHTSIDMRYIFADGTFDFRSGIWAQQRAHGFETWQGIVISVVFFLLGCALFDSPRSRRTAGWHPSALLAASLGIALLAGQAIAEQPRILATTIQWAKESPELQSEHRAERGNRTDREFLQAKMSEHFVVLESIRQPGPYVALALAACLGVLGLVELRTTSQRQTDVSTAASPTAPRQAYEPSRTAGAQTPAPSPVSTASDVEDAREQVRGPALGLLIIGIFQCVVALILLLGSLLFMT